jgi:hypothetical protein
MAEFEKRLACVIKADGTIVRGYMIDKCEFDGVNKYTITWKIPLQGAAKTNFAGTIGSALEEPVARPDHGRARRRSVAIVGPYF